MTCVFSHILLFILAIFLLAIALGCDSDNKNNANAQPAPMSCTDVTQESLTLLLSRAARLIEGISANDALIVEIDSTGDKTGDATVTNTSSGTKAQCSGSTEETLPPAEVMSCKVSSSTNRGIKTNDELEFGINFSSQSKQVILTNLSAPTVITCAFVTIDTINANN